MRLGSTCTPPRTRAHARTHTYACTHTSHGRADALAGARRRRSSGGDDGWRRAARRSALGWCTAAHCCGGAVGRPCRRAVALSQLALTPTWISRGLVFSTLWQLGRCVAQDCAGAGLNIERQEVTWTRCRRILPGYTRVLVRCGHILASCGPIVTRQIPFGVGRGRGAVPSQVVKAAAVLPALCATTGGFGFGST